MEHRSIKCMETWEQRLIDEMYSIIDQLSVCLSRQDPRLQGKLDNLIILCELASYLSQRSRNEEKMEISSELESTIKKVVELWEEQHDSGFHERENIVLDEFVMH